MPGNWNSGRRPNPTAVHKLRGNPGRRPLNEREPQPQRAGDAFDTPPELIADAPVAASEWRRLAPMMRAAGMVSDTDRHALLATCQHWAMYVAAMADVQARGVMIKGRGGPVRNPSVRAMHDELHALMRLWTELGLTPSSRSRMVRLPGAESGSKWDGLIENAG